MWYTAAAKYLRLCMVIDSALGSGSDNPVIVKQIGKSHMCKAAMLTRLDQHKTALFKYHQAFQCFSYVISYHSNTSLSPKKKTSKEVDLLLVCLISICKLFYYLGYESAGSETLNLILTASRGVYKPTTEMSSYIANMIFHYDSQHNRVMDEKMQFEKIVTAMYRKRFDPVHGYEGYKYDDKDEGQQCKDGLYNIAIKYCINQKDEEMYYKVLFENANTKSSAQSEHASKSRLPNESSTLKVIGLSNRKESPSKNNLKTYETLLSPKKPSILRGRHATNTQRGQISSFRVNNQSPNRHRSSMSRIADIESMQNKSIEDLGEFRGSKLKRFAVRKIKEMVEATSPPRLSNARKSAFDIKVDQKPHRENHFASKSFHTSRVPTTNITSLNNSIERPQDTSTLNGHDLRGRSTSTHIPDIRCYDHADFRPVLREDGTLGNFSNKLIGESLPDLETMLNTKRKTWHASSCLTCMIKRRFYAARWC